MELEKNKNELNNKNNEISKLTKRISDLELKINLTKIKYEKEISHLSLNSLAHSETVFLFVDDYIKYLSSLKFEGDIGVLSLKILS